MTDKNPIVNPVVVLREEFDDWAVLFNPDTGEAVGINPVGVEVWKLMDGTRDLETIIPRIAEVFDGVSETAPEEIEAFVRDLTERGFIDDESGEGGR